MILIEHVTGCDRVIHELNDSDSVRRMPGLLALVEEHRIDSLTPQGSALFIMPLFLGAFLRDLTTHPCRELHLKCHGFVRGPCCGHWLWVWGVVYIFYHSLLSSPFWYPHGYMLRVSTKQRDLSKIFVGKVLICEKKKKHPSSHPRKMKNRCAVMPFSVLVYELLFD